MSNPKEFQFNRETKIHTIEEEDTTSKNVSILNIVNSITKNEDSKQPINNKRYSRDSEYNFENDKFLNNFKQNPNDAYFPFSLNKANEKKYDYSTVETEKYTKETKQSSNKNTKVEKKINFQEMENNYPKISEFKLVDPNKDINEINEINKITENVVGIKTFNDSKNNNYIAQNLKENKENLNINNQNLKSQNEENDISISRNHTINNLNTDNLIAKKNYYYFNYRNYDSNLKNFDDIEENDIQLTNINLEVTKDNTNNINNTVTHESKITKTEKTENQLEKQTCTIESNGDPQKNIDLNLIVQKEYEKYQKELKKNINNTKINDNKSRNYNFYNNQYFNNTNENNINNNLNTNISNNTLLETLGINTMDSVNLKKINEDEEKRSKEIEDEANKLKALEEEKSKLILEEQERRQKILDEITKQEKEEKKRKMKIRFEECRKKKMEDENRLKLIKMEQERKLKEINELRQNKKIDEEKLSLLNEGKLNSKERRLYEYSLKKNNSNYDINNNMYNTKYSMSYKELISFNENEKDNNYYTHYKTNNPNNDFGKFTPIINNGIKNNNYITNHDKNFSPNNNGSTQYSEIEKTTSAFLDKEKHNDLFNEYNTVVSNSKIKNKINFMDSTGLHLKSNFNSLENSKLLYDNNNNKKLNKTKSTPKLNNYVKFTFKNPYNNDDPNAKMITSYEEENNERNRLNSFYDFNSRNKKNIKNVQYEVRTYQANTRSSKQLPFNINKEKEIIKEKNSHDRVFLSPTLDKVNYSGKILERINSLSENENFLKNNENINIEIGKDNMNIMMYNDKKIENNKSLKKDYLFDSTDFKFSPYYKEIYGS